MAVQVVLKIAGGHASASEMAEYPVPLAPGMVVLDAVHSVQAIHAPDPAVRWNCKSGRTITDNAIIPLKERVVDRFYDPIKMVFRILIGK
jgi:succinate dehydrogenase/fumarate reductase-like Fe-S protein